MKTPENFNHDPNVGLTPMSADHTFMDKSVLSFDNAPMGAVTMASKSNGKVNESVLSSMPNDIGGVEMGKK